MLELALAKSGCGLANAKETSPNPRRRIRIMG